MFLWIGEVLEAGIEESGINTGDFTFEVNASAYNAMATDKVLPIQVGIFPNDGILSYFRFRANKSITFDG